MLGICWNLVYLSAVWPGYKRCYLSPNLLCCGDCIVCQWSHCISIVLSDHQTTGIAVKGSGLEKEGSLCRCWSEVILVTIATKSI